MGPIPWLTGALMAKRTSSLKAAGVYDRGKAWQVKISRADSRGLLHRINRSFPYDALAPASHPYSRTSRFHEAAAFAASERNALRIERRSLPETKAAQTLGVWLDRYEREETPKKKSANRERSTLSQIRVLFPQLLKRQVADLRPSDFVGHEPHSVEGIMRKVYARATIRRYLTTLSHVFTVARSRWNYDGDHPLRGVEKPSAHDERTRIISDEEWKRIEEGWGETSPAVVAAIRWLRWTAARRGEAVALLWSDIDWTSSPPTAHLQNTKAKHGTPAQSRHIPLVPEAVAALEALKSGDWPTSGSVFDGVKADSITRAWARVCERAEVIDARIHDLRHTRITEMAPFLPLQVLARLTGHREPATLMRYYNPSGKDAAAAGRAIAAEYEGLRKQEV
jgi:integrase